MASGLSHTLSWLQGYLGTWNAAFDFGTESGLSMGSNPGGPSFPSSFSAHHFSHSGFRPNRFN